MTIRQRILFIIFAANVVLLATFYLLSVAFLRTELSQHAVDQQFAELAPVMKALVNIYQDNHSWNTIRNDRGRWHQIMRNQHEAPIPQRPNRIAHHPPLPRSSGLTDPRVFLADKDHQVIIGPHEYASDVTWQPIVVANLTVGYLGLLIDQQAFDSIYGATLRNLNRSMLWGGLLSLIVALLFSYIFSQRILTRLRLITNQIHKLSGGFFNIEASTKGKDEIARLTKDVIALAKTLSAHQQSQQQWFSDIAHELRTPVSVLRAEVEAMQDGVRRTDALQLKSLNSEISALQKLLDELRMLSLADEGSLTYQKAPVNLTRFIENFITSHRHRLQTNGLSVTTTLNNRMIMVMADENKLEQLLKNLLQNSERYTDAPGQISITLNQQGSDAILLWEDSAPGVNDDELLRLFDRLYRVDASRTRLAGGSGLGLSIVNSIVVAHSGTVTATHSDLGGISINIHLPVESRE